MVNFIKDKLEEGDLGGIDRGLIINFMDSVIYDTFLEHEKLVRDSKKSEELTKLVSLKTMKGLESSKIPILNLNLGQGNLVEWFLSVAHKAESLVSNQVSYAAFVTTLKGTLVKSFSSATLSVCSSIDIIMQLLKPKVSGRVGFQVVLNYLPASSKNKGIFCGRKLG